MNATIPDSLRDFVERQVNEGRYANSDAFVSDLIHAEAEIFERTNRGEALPVDARFDRRLEALLDEGEHSGDYVEVTREDFDAMEREALSLIGQHRST